MYKHQKFKKLFNASELDVDNLSEKDLKKLGITIHEFKVGGKKVVYYLFYGTNRMLHFLPFAS